MNLTGHGTFHFSQDEGRVIDCDLKVDAAIKTSGLLSGGGQMDMKMDILMRMTP